MIRSHQARPGGYVQGGPDGGISGGPAGDFGEGSPQTNGFEQGAAQLGGFEEGGPQPGGFEQGGPQPGGFDQGGPQPGGFEQGGPPPGGFEQGAPQPGGMEQGGPPPGGFEQEGSPNDAFGGGPAGGPAGGPPGEPAGGPTGGFGGQPQLPQRTPPQAQQPPPQSEQFPYQLDPAAASFAAASGDLQARGSQTLQARSASGSSAAAFQGSIAGKSRQTSKAVGANGAVRSRKQPNGVIASGMSEAPAGGRPNRPYTGRAQMSSKSQAAQPPSQPNRLAEPAPRQPAAAVHQTVASVQKPALGARPQVSTAQQPAAAQALSAQSVPNTIAKPPGKFKTRKVILVKGKPTHSPKTRLAGSADGSVQPLVTASGALSQSDRTQLIAETVGAAKTAAQSVASQPKYSRPVLVKPMPASKPAQPTKASQPVNQNNQQGDNFGSRITKRYGTG